MSKNYQSEWDGQVDFYSRINLSVDFVVNSDGVYKGVLFENKLTINNVGAVLSQLIRYASKIRLLGKPLPYYLIANDLNREIAYIFNKENNGEFFGITGPEGYYLITKDKRVKKVYRTYRAKYNF